MNWLQRYRLRYFVTHSIWLLPLLGMAEAIGAVRALDWVEAVMGWQSSLHPDTTRAVLRNC